MLPASLPEERELRLCARPGCGQPSAVTLTCDYASRVVFLGPVEPVDPSRYDLCARHATRFRPPRGWDLVQERSTPARPVPALSAMTAGV